MASIAQTSEQPADRTNQSLLSQMQELRATVDSMRAELAAIRRESQDLRKELEEARRQTAPGPKAAAAPAEPAREVDSKQSEEQQLTDAKLSDLYQTKVASGSKYRVRLSGLALFNASTTRGPVDQLDVPLIAEPDSAGTRGTFGATVRQSRISLEVFGPEWRGARTSGDVSVDFFGGFPSTPEGISTGLVRLRTAKVSLDWKNTSIVAGQDELFFSPLSPSSLASTAYPAFSNAGNLWTWTPQIRVEHRWELSEQDKVSIAGGILDPLTGELPASEYDRMPTAGERSRIPAWAARIGWQRTANDRTTGLGAGGYYSRQKWLGGQAVDAWAATADWNVPLGPFFSLSGEMYRGRAIGGLGGGINGSVVAILTGTIAVPGGGVTSASASSVSVRTLVFPIEDTGGWAQLKFKPLPKIEFNSALGMDHGYLSHRYPAFLAGTLVQRNLSGMFNVIYQPRSSLLFSVEYRRLRTVLSNAPVTADHVNLAAGIVF